MRLVCCEVVQNSYRISDKYQSDFIGQLGMAIAVLTLECQEFGLAGKSSNLLVFTQNPREGQGNWC